MQKMQRCYRRRRSRRAVPFGDILDIITLKASGICTPCVLKEEENFDKIDFAGYVNSGLDFALNSPDAILNPDPANTKKQLEELLVRNSGCA